MDIIFRERDFLDRDLFLEACFLGIQHLENVTII